MSKDNLDDFDDKLDDEYEPNNMNEKNVDNLVKSFARPNDTDTPIDNNTMNKLLNQVQNMPKAKLKQYLNQLTGKDNFIANDHSTKTRDKLRKKLAEKKRNMKTKTVKQSDDYMSNKNTNLRSIDDIMKEIESIDKKPKKKNKKK